ncbi:MAG TPA: M36 family metallopeptidase, partial [Vicinamibacterales bacterium]
ASMLWEGYVALQKSNPFPSGFERVRRRMSSYVVAGLQMTPRDATYTEQRDAILAAAAAGRNRRVDLGVLANAFARRGAGSCAIAPPRTSTDFLGVTESYEVRPRIEIGAISLEEDRRSCDGDDYLDAGEQGWVAITVMNGGATPMLDTVVTVSSTTSGIFFPRGLSARIRRIEPLGSTRVFIRIALDRTTSGLGSLELQVNVSNGEACEPVVSRSFTERINADDVANASRIDAVETKITPWGLAGTDANAIWSRVEATPADRAWLGIDSGRATDTALQSPALLVGATDPLVITFEHRYSFEFDATDDIFFDGGVIEISLNNGATWEDISAHVDPGYGGTLFDDSGNPLGGRPAFVAQNDGWPARDPVTLNLGAGFAGRTVLVRFRIGTDGGVGDFGWEIDNIAVAGITNTPFPMLVEDRMMCRP